MLTLSPQTKNLKIIHLEDDRVTQRIVSDFIKIHYSNIDLIQHDHGMSIYMDIGFERPDLIIVDWNLKDCCASELLSALVRFKGKVVFFSSENESLISNCIQEFCGDLPKNFTVISKVCSSGYKDLMKEIKSHAQKIDKDI